MRQTLPQHRSGTESSRCWLPTNFLFVVTFPPKFEKAKFSTNTGITPKSNENSELKKENAAKQQNWIKVNRKWPRLYACITISSLPPDSMQNRNTGITQKYRNPVHCGLEEEFGKCIRQIVVYFTCDSSFFRDSGISNFAPYPAANQK